MSSILEQDPGASVSEVLEGVPEKFITRRESLRMRALIGTVPVRTLADYDTAGLAAILASEPDGTMADPNVVCGFTLRMSHKRVAAVAEFFLSYLHNGLPVMEDPEPTPEPVPASPSGSTRGKGPSPTLPRKKAGIPITLADLRTQAQGSSLPVRGGSSKPKPAPRGRPAGTPAELARIRRSAPQ